MVNKYQSPRITGLLREGGDISDTFPTQQGMKMKRQQGPRRRTDPCRTGVSQPCDLRVSLSVFSVSAKIPQRPSQQRPHTGPAPARMAHSSTVTREGVPGAAGTVSGCEHGCGGRREWVRILALPLDLGQVRPPLSALVFARDYRQESLIITWFSDIDTLRSVVPSLQETPSGILWVGGWVGQRAADWLHPVWSHRALHFKGP